MLSGPADRRTVNIMTVIIHRVQFVASIVAVGFLCCGCMSDYKLKLKPITGYPEVDRLDMKVNLVLENEFTEGGTMYRTESGLQNHRFNASGPVLTKSAEALACAVFRDVHVVNSMSAAMNEPAGCNAIIKPHLPEGKFEISGVCGGVILSMEWTVTRPNGDLLWKKNFGAESSKGTWPGTHVQDALEQIFATSFTNIYQSPAIRALAKQPSATRPPTESRANE
jgi:hypothetical protein